VGLPEVPQQLRPSLPGRPVRAVQQPGMIVIFLLALGAYMGIMTYRLLSR
jgi:hypothetical protein